MQQPRPEESGRATLNACGIVYDFRRFGADARCEGKSRMQLAGLELYNLPCLQFILIQL
jgi:hypothetical protein